MCKINYGYEFDKPLEEMSLEELDDLKSQFAEIRRLNKLATRQIQSVYQQKLINQRAIEKMGLPKGMEGVTINIPTGVLSAQTKDVKVDTNDR